MTKPTVLLVPDEEGKFPIRRLRGSSAVAWDDEYKVWFRIVYASVIDRATGIVEFKGSHVVAWDGQCWSKAYAMQIWLSPQLKESP